MIVKNSAAYALPLLALIAGCASLPPAGPGIIALPGTGKTFEQFRLDDGQCRGFAFNQATSMPMGTMRNRSIESAAGGTILGAATGVAFDGGRGAAIGAGTGLLIGSAIGANTATVSEQEMQRQYDIGYTQCMYALGNRVPISRGMTNDFDSGRYPIPAPPPGTPPSPPLKW